jgi:hypothetical protein
MGPIRNRIVRSCISPYQLRKRTYAINPYRSMNQKPVILKCTNLFVVIRWDTVTKVIVERVSDFDDEYKAHVRFSTVNDWDVEMREIRMDCNFNDVDFHVIDSVDTHENTFHFVIDHYIYVSITQDTSRNFSMESKDYGWEIRYAYHGQSVEVGV